MAYNVLMVKTQKLLVGYKLFFGLLGLSAIATEIIVIMGRGRFVPENFFSYFTIESNIFAAVMLIASALMLLKRRQGAGIAFLRGAATLYMMITGIVFSILLSGYDALTAVPWDNIVLHYIIPIAVLIDWILDPPTRAITFKNATLWLLYPLLYLVYSLVRGLLVDWYPYPFLNPMLDGYAGIVWVSMGILALSLLLAWLLSGTKRRTK